MRRARVLLAGVVLCAVVLTVSGHREVVRTGLGSGLDKVASSTPDAPGRTALPAIGSARAQRTDTAPDSGELLASESTAADQARSGSTSANSSDKAKDKTKDESGAKDKQPGKGPKDRDGSEEPPPGPGPEPDPDPGPAPEPDPDPAPDPDPEPTPDPTPDPDPEPAPDPAPDPAPRPAIAATVGPDGALLESDDGALRLAFPPGALEETVTITATRLSDPERTIGVLRIAGVFAIECPAPLHLPVTVSIRHELGVEHFQVAGRLLQAASLMTREAGGEVWVQGAKDTTLDGSYLTGKVDHFSEWTAGTIQPHGTNPATTDYCSGVCHDLVSEPGSTIRIDARDKQACYLCHGNSDPHSPPDGASGENVQAAMFDVEGQERPVSASSHPVRGATDTFGLWCTSCHDPHADPIQAPGLLRATDTLGKIVKQGGNEFCWACHGTARNRRVDFLAPGYYTRTGGDKKGLFEQTSHASVPVSWEGTERQSVHVVRRTITSSGQLYRELGATLWNLTHATESGVSFVRFWSSGTSATGHPGMEVASSVEADDLSKMFDGDDVSRTLFGPFPSGTTQSDFDITIDLGLPQTLNMFGMNSGRGPAAAVKGVAVYTSMDGVTWTLRGTRTDPTYNDGEFIQHAFSFTPVQARWIRARVTDTYTEQYRYAGITSLWVSAQQPSWGCWTSGPLSIAGPGFAGESSVSYDASVPEGSGIVLESRVSTDGGGSWSPWAVQGNGSPIPGLADGPDLRNGVIMYRALFTRNSTLIDPRLSEISHEIDVVDDAPIASTATQGCTGCHVSHGSEGSALLPTSELDLCFRCHEEKASGYVQSEHGDQKCSRCHDAHGRLNASTGTLYPTLLVDRETTLCFGCHDSAAASRNGVNIKERFTRPHTATNHTTNRWIRRHNVDESEQALLGNRISCSDCHGVHEATGESFLIDPVDQSRPFPKTRPEPRILRIPLTADAYVEQGSATPQGATSVLSLSSTKNILVKFDLSQIPQGAEILRSTLVLRQHSPAESFQEATRRLQIHRLGQSWDEAGVTWTSRGPALGAWTTPGGTRSGSHYMDSPWGAFRFDVTSLVEALQVGPDHGVLISATGFWGTVEQTTASREVGDGGPYLEIAYHPAEGPDMGYDMIEYCLRCHSGIMPSGVQIGGTGSATLSLKDIGSSWHQSMHGGRLGYPAPQSSTGGYRAYGNLRPPYSYTYSESLQCTLCHDAHGSSNAYHLRDDGVIDSMTGGVQYVTAMQYAKGAEWCAQCHYGAEHANSSTLRCNNCHTHAPLNLGRF